MSQEAEIIEAFQLHGNQMTLAQMIPYSWAWEFRARKRDINKDDPKWILRLVSRGEKASQNLYALEKKPKPGELL